MDSPSISDKQALYESGLSIASQSSLVIERALMQAEVTNTQKFVAGNSMCDALQGSPPNHSLKLTESTAHDFAAHKIVD